MVTLSQRYKCLLHSTFSLVLILAALAAWSFTVSYHYLNANTVMIVSRGRGATWGKGSKAKSGGADVPDVAPCGTRRGARGMPWASWRRGSIYARRGRHGSIYARWDSRVSMQTDGITNAPFRGFGETLNTLIRRLAKRPMRHFAD